MVLLVVVILVISIEIIMKYVSKVVGCLYDIVHNNKNVSWKMSQEYAELKKQQKLINIQDEFAKHARIQRKLIKLEDSLKKLKSNRSSTTLKWKWVTQIAVYVLYALMMFSILYFKRQEPAITLPEKWFPLLNGVLRFPTTINGSIGVPAWIFICRQFSRAILQWIFIVEFYSGYCLLVTYICIVVSFFLEEKKRFILWNFLNICCKFHTLKS